MCTWICAHVRVQVCFLAVFCFACGDLFYVFCYISFFFSYVKGGGWECSVDTTSDDV